jgi:hypothetical protein
MKEPRLEDSTDYNGLRGNKKNVVYAVIFMLLAIGMLYAIVKKQNDYVEDEIPQGKRVDYIKK